MKKTYLLILAGLGLLTVLFLQSPGSMDLPENEGRYGVLPGAYDPKEFGEQGSHTLSYYVPLPYPPKKALDFYGRALRRKGWKPDPGWKGMGEQEKWTSWSAESSLTREGLICAYQFHKGWVHRDGGRFLILIFNYYDTLRGAGCEPTPRSGELMVTLQEMPKR